MLEDIPQTWDEVWALEPGVYSWVQDIPLEWQPDGTPSGTLRVELSVHNSAPDVPSGTRSVMLSYIDGAATRVRYIGERSSVGDHWAKLAIAQPPQEFDLPLADGLQVVFGYGSNKYWKNQFGEVGVTLCITKTDVGTNDIENTSLLATLPAGFRPATMISGAAFVDRGEESVVYPAFILIYPDGSVRINQSNEVSCSLVIASMSFLAAG